MTPLLNSLHVNYFSDDLQWIKTCAVKQYSIACHTWSLATYKFVEFVEYGVAVLRLI